MQKPLSSNISISMIYFTHLSLKRCNRSHFQTFDQSYCHPFSFFQLNMLLKWAAPNECNASFVPYIPKIWTEFYTDWKNENRTISECSGVFYHWLWDDLCDWIWRQCIHVTLVLPDRTVYPFFSHASLSCSQSITAQTYRNIFRSPCVTLFFPKRYKWLFKNFIHSLNKGHAEYRLTQNVHEKGGYSIIRLPIWNQLKTSEGKINCNMMTNYHLLHIPGSKYSFTEAAYTAGGPLISSKQILSNKNMIIYSWSEW